MTKLAQHIKMQSNVRMAITKPGYPIGNAEIAFPGQI
jgi:hypothetical protein